LPKRSHLYEYHEEHGKITEFGGFEMPLWYKGIIEEHDAVRDSVGIFDVSHMGRFLIKGTQATDLLDTLLPTSAVKVKTGKAFYSAICNENGGIIDDLVTCKIAAGEFLMVVNASNREKDLSWLESHAQNFSVEIIDVSNDTALIALQGPRAASTLQRLVDIDLSNVGRFGLAYCKVDDEKCMISRTGYTGEDGFEIMVLDTPLEHPERAVKIWKALLGEESATGAFPCGLGARDLLRLEAGMCLYGQDIDVTTSPVEAALNIVDADKAISYPGSRVILSQMTEGTEKTRVTFSMDQDGIPRHDYDIVIGDKKLGRVTSGSFSPILRKGIGMGYVPSARSEIGSNMFVMIRNAQRAATIVRPPFYDKTKYGYSRAK